MLRGYGGYGGLLADDAMFPADIALTGSEFHRVGVAIEKALRTLRRLSANEKWIRTR